MEKSNRLEADIKTDKFNDQEATRIVEMVIQDYEADDSVLTQWVEDKKKDLQHYYAEKPSILEGLDKKGWHSDRNLGICPAICDTYQSTLFNTCWNPDTLHFMATDKNDVDNKDNLEKFTKWLVGQNEVHVSPEIDDYIHNKITQGFSVFKVYWHVWWEWVDRRIPRKDGSLEVVTEKVRFEKAVLENIDNLDDIKTPRYGDSIQKLPHIIQVIHLTADKIKELSENGVFTEADDKYIESLKSATLAKMRDSLEKERANQLKLADVFDEDMRALPIDLYEWYGTYTKNGRTEKYRFVVDPINKKLLSYKPLRKINRKGKYPFIAGPFIRIPGQLRGKSMPRLIKEPVNGINTVFNMKADFQYVTNCPFGFHKANEGYTQKQYELEPMISYPTEGNPNEENFFPNLQRSMAWADQDYRILMEVIEKLTGAASYFQTNMRNASGTATRDRIVEANSQSRFGIWVTRIQDEICEAIDMLVCLYQDNAPKNLGERILGEDGKQLFENFSVETIRYNGRPQISPDIIAGSKEYERDAALWGLQNLSMSPWFDPRINPKGNYLLVSDAMKRVGLANPARYLPPEPKPELGAGQDVDNIWSRLMKGEAVEPQPNWNLPEVIVGLYKKKTESFYDLDPEYRPNLDMLLFKTEIMYQELTKKIIEDQMANQLAQRAIMGGQNPQGGPPQPGIQQPPMQPQPAQPQPIQQPGGMPNGRP